MVRAAIKILIGAVIVDALAAVWLVTENSYQLLTWWLLANAVAVPALVIAVLRRRRSRQALQKRPGRISFSEHKKLHGTVHKTRNGEVVKSGGERIIADYFYHSKIRYQYEKAAIGDSGRRISRPDFYLPDYDVYVEYWGMADTKDSKDRNAYAKSMEWKMARYHENGIKVVSIFPREIDNIYIVFQKKLKEVL
ncbi:hypothetical protein [Candidatus Nitrososphaera sp. FF02]|uniref:hypothetical protein n=1 Tax=Candidatus Nitrososphaera sp. FF02 TaxID=3398226 RepID=UPI0039EC52C2